MIVTRGLGSSLIVTQGYGRKYLSPFVKVRDFELSVYKFIKENYADSHGYKVYYSDLAADIDSEDIWLYCNFSELNVETGKFSLGYINVVTRVASVNEYNTQLSIIIDDLRDVFSNSDIALYDFTYPEYPQVLLTEKIVLMSDGKQIYERIEELKFEEVKVLTQAATMTVKLKLLKNFSKV